MARPVGAESEEQLQDQASATVERAKPVPYRMPSIEPGEIVVWAYTPDAESYAAIVTRVGNNAISLFMIPPDSRRGELKDGVRHVDDPDLPRLMSEGGCWRDTRSMALLRDLGRLRKDPAWM